MRRSDRARDRAFSYALIDGCTFGVIAISTPGDTPYCLPLSLVRVENSLYFHCAQQGRKLDLLRENPRVCVSFVGRSEPQYVARNNMYTDYFQSAIVTGTAYELTQDTDKSEALRVLCQTLTPQGMVGDCFARAIATSLNATSVWRIDIDEVTGKAKEPS